MVNKFYVNSKNLLFANIIVFGSIISAQYLYNTFILENTSRLESIRKVDENNTSGAVYINNNEIYFRTFEDLLENNLDILEKQVKVSKKQEKRITEQNDSTPDLTNGRGTGSCVNYKGENYILTNEHVVNGLSKDREKKLFSDVKLDISLIPFSELKSHTISNLEDCVKLKKTGEILGKEYSFVGWGRDLYQSTGVIQKDIDALNREYNRYSLIYENDSLNPYNNYFLNNFPGVSGSTLYDKSGENVLGVFHSVAGFSNLNPLDIRRYIYYPMNKTSGYFTPINDVVDWFDKKLESENSQVTQNLENSNLEYNNFSDLNKKLDEYLYIIKKK